MMDSNVLIAMIGLVGTVVTLLGTFAALWINKNMTNEADKKLALDMLGAVTGAVKATSQTLTTGQRDVRGQLPEVVASQAKSTALDMAKILLGSDQVKAAEAKYGVQGLDKVLSVQVEAALHDVKATKVTATTTTSTTTAGPEGGVVTRVQTQATAATEPVAPPSPVVAP